MLGSVGWLKFAMNNTQPSLIRHREWAAVLKDFSGLRYGKITPTDIDAFIDFQDKAFIFVEAKYGSSCIPTGQALALQRLCDACRKAGKESVLFIVEHTTKTGEMIDLANLPIRTMRWRDKWIPLNKEYNLREGIEFFRLSCIAEGILK